MAKNTAESYIKYEIEWFEKKVEQLRNEVDNILENLEDRTETFITQKGIPTVKIISTKETQLKMAKDIMISLPPMFEALEQMREKKAVSSIEVRGGMNMNGMLKNKLENEQT